jgi:hypothetical protein
VQDRATPGQRAVGLVDRVEGNHVSALLSA